MEKRRKFREHLRIVVLLALVALLAVACAQEAAPASEEMSEPDADTTSVEGVKDVPREGTWDRRLVGQR